MNLGNLDITGLYMGNVPASAYVGSELVWPTTPPTPPVPPTPVYSAMPLTLEVTSAGTIMLKATDTSVTKTIQYKLNDGNWTSMTTSTAGTTWNVSAGDKLQFMGDNLTYGSGQTSLNASGTKYNTFSGSTAWFKVYGNLMSLRDSTGYTTADTMGNYFVTSLFRGCTGLTDATNLILPNFLSGVCYCNMFNSCTNLTAAPVLPATGTGDAWCYCGMFRYCSELTTAPDLPLSIIGTNAYANLFQGCTKLNYIKCLLTNTYPQFLASWVSGVAATGTFVKDANTSWSTGSSGIPNGWTVVDYSE